VDGRGARVRRDTAQLALAFPLREQPGSRPTSIIVSTRSMPGIVGWVLIARGRDAAVYLLFSKSLGMTLLKAFKGRRVRLIRAMTTRAVRFKGAKRTNVHLDP